ncbi:hypothetical protein INT45_012854 [Circinella minor]|uniref:DDE Tnp4 domain-containing protein n=1 Tax=Circinella minor TaxID=1195481 RepID=A0A8H7VIN2_9FUNG|nr:hypothetical protein INT45_012854 [Circinella minor]
MKDIKDELLEKLEYIPVYYFLTKLYTNQEYLGPYHEIEKGLILLYHIVSVLAANAYNPNDFENVTLYIDGHNSKIKYYNPNESSSGLYSYKLKGPGLRTQIVVDINKSILYISNSEKCAKGNDGTMFLNMKLYRNINSLDCIGMDGGYNLFVDKFIENVIEYGYNYSQNNFVYPIRKEVSKNLTVNELNYNSKFGSFRSEIKSQFSVLASKFNRFNNNKAALQMSDKKYYNLQFRVGAYLLPIVFI